MSFVHLHNHSHYSLLDAVTKADELPKVAKALGFSAVALTDHGNMYGAIEFYEKCEKEEIKPIIGVEICVTTNHSDKQTPNQNAFHLVLLALNYTGYRNLIQLVSISHTAGLHLAKPRVDKELLKKYHEGLVALSGCLEGEIPHILHKEQNFEKAKKIALEYEEIFGKENFYLELNDLPGLEGQLETNSQLIGVSKDTGIPLVVTRDSHYLEPEDAEAQDVLVCVREGQTLENPNRQSMVGVDYSLAKAEDITNRFKHVPEAIENTGKIADRVELKLELNKWHFAHVDLPPGETADTHLRNQVYEKLPKLMEVTDQVRERADYELGIISKKGYSPYFLVVADYVQFARDHDIVETTRGSGAGSIVSYALGITTVNPLYFKLPFERFLNPFRPSPPDIDADFADDRRDEMIAYVTKKYGADKVAQIITFGTMAARGAVRDVGRALGYSYSFCDQVSKLIPFGAQGFQITIKKAMDLEPDLKALYEKNPQARRLLDLAQKVEGCARHTSMHAAGVVISPTPLTDFTPVQYEVGGEKLTTQYEMHAVEAAGVLKMDFLGIRNLSILGNAVEIVQKTTGQKIDIYNLPWDDKKTFDMLARGETTGVFQLSGSGMTRYLKELKPTTIFDIMAMVALFRPGPMEVIPDYIKRKHHPETIEYLDPRMESYLDQSLGLIVYQDDVLLTAINLAGYNWEEADKFRKAMGKKIPEEMMKQKEKFVNGCKQVGKLKDSLIDVLWKRIEPFAAYGFNKAHAASYAVVAYQTAYLKANFPTQYMTAILIAESGDIDKVPPVIHECGRMNVKVLPPDINESFKSFAMIPKDETHEVEHIRFGLNGIKNLGEHIAEVIYRERKNNGKYNDLEDFLKRVKDRDLNKKSVESLVKCGALDSFGYDRNQLLMNIENIISFCKHSQEDSSKKQFTLFSGTAIDVAHKLRLDSAPAATESQKMTWEKELLGLYVTSHPFAQFQKIMQQSLTPIKDLGGQSRNKWVVVGGVIDSTKKKITRAGKPMMFVTIQDTTSSLELLVFPKTYETTKDVWIEGKMACVIGKTSEDEGDDKLFVEKAYELTPENVHDLAQQLSIGSSVSAKNTSPQEDYSMLPVQEDINPPLLVLVDAVEIAVSPQVMKDKAEELKTLFGNHPGDKTVFLKVGEKKIKTSFSVDGSEEFQKEILGIL
jgi:DNA polymerase-3 subunit alpha